MKTKHLLAIALSLGALAAGCSTVQQPATPITPQRVSAPAPPSPLSPPTGRVRAFAVTAPEYPAVNPKMKLSWTPNQPGEGVIEYRIFRGDTNAPGTVPVFVTDSPPVSLSFMTEVPNGVYRFELTAVNSSGLESQKSLPVWLFWYGHPNPPQDVGIIFE